MIITSNAVLLFIAHSFTALAVTIVGIVILANVIDSNRRTR